MVLAFALILSIGTTGVSAAEDSAAITRGEFAKMLWELSGSGRPGPNANLPFTDVDPDYAEAVAYLYTKGVFSDYSDNIFGQNEPVTWEMAYVMAARNWNLAPDSPESYTGYEDATDLSEWAQSAASYMFERELGASEFQCHPQHPITYDEASAFLASVRDVCDKEYFKPGGELDTFLEKLAADDLFSGTVGVSKYGEVIFENGYGFLNRENEVKMPPDAKINVGSINKSMTAVAICQLVQAGKMSYDDLLETYVPEFAELSKGRITIELLLRHSAGLGNFFQNEEYMKNKDNIDTIQGMIPYTIPDELLFEPGTDVSYSNSSYVILGAVIESVSGEDYFDYIEHYIFTPAGMENSGYFSKFSDTNNMANGYYFDESHNLVNNFDTLPARGSSAGGGYSTAGDLLRYMDALNNDVLLYNTLDEVIPSVVAGTFSGGSTGVKATCDNRPASGYAVTILANTDAGYDRVTNEINRFLFNAQPSPSIGQAQVHINGELLITTMLTELNGEKWLSLIAVCDALGATVNNDTIELNDVILTISDEGVICTVNGETQPVTTRRLNLNGKMTIFVPVQFLIDTFGCQIITP